MEDSERIKEFDLNGRHWRAHKFTAKVGARVAWIFTGREGGLGSLPELSDSEFERVQRACLSVCEGQLAAGWTKVVDDAGNFAIQGLEEDTKTVFGLMMAALDWNLRDFSPGSPSASPQP